MKGLWRTLFLTPILSINHPTSHTHKIVSYSPKPCFHSPSPTPKPLSIDGKLSSACKKGSLSSMTRNNKNKHILEFSMDDETEQETNEGK